MGNGAFGMCEVWVTRYPSTEKGPKKLTAITLAIYRKQ